jgi:uncharacterized membrane protein
MAVRLLKIGKIRRAGRAPERRPRRLALAGAWSPFGVPEGAIIHPRHRLDRPDATVRTTESTEPTSSHQIVRVLLGAGLAIAGVAHLTWARSEFLAQVPGWVPLDADLVVVLSGLVEIVLGAALALLPRYRVLLGWVTAAFFIAVFPGNISQFVDGDAAFGLDNDAARAVRLVFQPVLIALALWSTGAWAAAQRASG